MITYENEDEEYLLWLEKSETGFVFNEIKQRATDPPLTLHTTRCGHLRHPDKKLTHTDHKKICSRSRQELVNWAHKTSTKFKECPDCKP